MDELLEEKGYMMNNRNQYEVVVKLIEEVFAKKL